MNRNPNLPTVASSIGSKENVIGSSDDTDNDLEEIELFVDRGAKRKRGAGSRHPKLQKVSARQGGADRVPPAGSYNSSWPWYTRQWMAPQPTQALPPWSLYLPIQSYPVSLSGCLPGDLQETEDWQRKQKKHAIDELAIKDSSPAVLKPCKVIVHEGGEVDASCSRKNVWDQVVRTFVLKTMDLSVVEWSQQKPQAVKKLRSLLDNEF